MSSCLDVPGLAWPACIAHLCRVGLCDKAMETTFDLRAWHLDTKINRPDNDNAIENLRMHACNGLCAEQYVQHR